MNKVEEAARDTIGTAAQKEAYLKLQGRWKEVGEPKVSF